MGSVSASFSPSNPFLVPAIPSLWFWQMSYNNYLDGDAAYSAACDFSEPTCVIVKHTNPCGVASLGDLREAYRLAVRADPTSAFGGIVAFNRFCLHALRRFNLAASTCLSGWICLRMKRWLRSM